MKNITLKILAGLALVVGAGSANAATYSDSEISQFITNNTQTEVNITFGASEASPLILVDSRVGLPAFKGTTSFNFCSVIGAYGKSSVTSYFQTSNSSSLEYGNVSSSTSTLLKSFLVCNSGHEYPDGTTHSDTVYISEDQIKEVLSIAAEQGYPVLRFALTDLYTTTTTRTSIGSTPTKTTTSYFYHNANIGYHFDAIVPAVFSRDLATDSVYLYQYGEFSWDTDVSYNRYKIRRFHKDMDRVYFSTAVNGANVTANTFVRKIAVNKTPGSTGHFIDTTFYNRTRKNLSTKPVLKDSVLKENFDVYVERGDSLITLQYGVATPRYKSFDGSRVYYDTVYTNGFELFPVYRFHYIIGKNAAREEIGYVRQIGDEFSHVGSVVRLEVYVYDKFDGAYYFDYWSNGLVGGEFVSFEKAFKVQIFSDTTLAANFSKSAGSGASFYIDNCTSNGASHCPENEIDFVMGVDSAGLGTDFYRLIPGHVVLQYANLNEEDYKDLYWDYISAADFTSKYLQTKYIEILKNGKIEKRSSRGKMIDANPVLSKDGVKFRFIYYGSESTDKSYEYAMQKANRTGFKTSYEKVFNWKYAVNFFSANGEKVSSSLYGYGEEFSAPTDLDRATLGGSDNSETQNYIYKWKPLNSSGSCSEELSATGSGVVSSYPCDYKVEFVETFTVMFVDYEGNVLYKDYVGRNGSAKAPEVPAREGFEFIGWNKDFSNVTGDMVVTAVYKEVIPYVATKEIRANQCGDLWCGVKQEERVNTGFTNTHETAGWWFGFDDAAYPGGKSKLEFAVGSDIYENIEQAYAIEGSFNLKPGYEFPLAGIGFNVVDGESEIGADISGWNGVCLAYSSTEELNIELAPENEAQLTGFNNPLATLEKSETVTFVDIPWSDFKQGAGWGTKAELSTILQKVMSFKIKSAGKSADFKLVTLGRYGTCNGESYVAKKEIEEEKCGDLWCGVKQETQVNTGYASEGGLAGEWFVFDDRNDGDGKNPSVLEFSVGGNFEENIQKASAIEGTFDLKSGVEYPYAGVGFFIGNDEKGYDISDWDGVCVAYKSSKKFSLEIVPQNEAAMTLFDNYSVSLPSGEVVFKNFLWSEFKQGGWGTKAELAAILNTANSFRIKYASSAGTSADFKIVSIGRYGTCDGQKKIVLDESAISEGLDLSKLDIDEKTFVKIPEGKQFYANKKIYSGILDAYQLEDLVDVTLKPISGVSLETNDEGELQAGLSGTLYTDKMIIPEDIEVDHVDINRTFTVDVAGTLVVPFSADVTSDMGDFIDVKKIEKEDGVWVATGNLVNRIEAHHPYVVRAASSTISFDDVIIEKNEDVKPSVNFGYNWTFNGAYNGKMWTDDDPEKGYAYGFAAAKQGNIKVGQFVKFATNGKIAPMRAYLVYNKTPRANAKPGYGVLQKAAIAEEEPPKSIVLRIVDEILDNTDSEEKVENKDASEDKTLIVIELQNATSEKADRWFDVLGHKLKNKPTVKGTYIKNGKPVSVK